MTNIGGGWTTQNKKLPGAYINVISTSAVTPALSDRGIVAFATSMDWGPEHQVLSVTAADFQRRARELFGYSATDPRLKGIADIFKNATQLFLYRLNSATGGTKAQVKFEPTTGTEVVVADAKWTGGRGNDLSVQIELNINSPENPTAENPLIYDVTTYLGGVVVDVQTKVALIADLEDNDFLVWRDATTIQEMVATATGGTTAAATAEDLESALTVLESYSYHVFGTDVEMTPSVGDYIVSYVKRIRDNTGAKMQAVIYAPVGIGFNVDYEGIIAVQNSAIVNSEGKTEDGFFGKTAAVFWVAGAEAAAAVNESLTGTEYNGSFPLEVDFSEDVLETYIDNGRLAFNRSGDTIEVLRDINGLTTFTETKNQDFSNNQVIRIVDQLTIETALVFNRTYKGKVQNDAIGEISLKTQIDKIYGQMQDLRAIENHTIDNLTVGPGERKESVLASSVVKPVVAMEFLYMNIYMI